MGFKVWLAQLDKEVANSSQIRLIIREFRRHLPELFPQRTEAPKTLSSAKTDSHAENVITIVRTGSSGSFSGIQEGIP